MLVIFFVLVYYQYIGYGVVANIIASHAIARGSIPRIRILQLDIEARITNDLRWVASCQGNLGRYEKISQMHPCLPVGYEHKDFLT